MPLSVRADLLFEKQNLFRKRTPLKNHLRDQIQQFLFLLFPPSVRESAAVNVKRRVKHNNNNNNNNNSSNNKPPISLEHHFSSKLLKTNRRCIYSYGIYIRRYTSQVP